MRLRSPRKGLVVSVSILALVMGMPVASADPIPDDTGPDGGTATEDHGAHTDHEDHDHSPGAAAELQTLGDAFAEGLVLPPDPFTVPEDQEPSGDSVRVTPEEPLVWPGSAPDPEDIPVEWLAEQPAEEITPSTTEELMNATDGYLGGGYAADSGGAEVSAEVLANVPAPPSKNLPPTLDAAPGWQYSYSCDPNNKTGMVALANLLASHYNRPTWYGSRRCIQGDNSQHYEGRAFDWTMNAYNPDQKAIGDSVAQWLTANNGEIAKRFGVQSIIWNRKSWYLYSPGSWRDYTGPSPHTDHLHISFTWDGAMGRTSWWSGTPITRHDHGTCRVYSGQYAPRYQGINRTPCTTNLPQPPTAPYPVTLPGARNDNVRQGQRFLGLTGSDVDGVFGPITLAHLLDYQSYYDLPWTGVLDKATWSRMIQVGIPDDPVPPFPAGVTRIAGKDRYATAVQISREYPVGSELFVTVGDNYPDALTTAARAGSVGGPVLLTRPDSVPPVVRTEIQRLKPSRITVVGGTGAISDAVLQELRGLTSAPVVRRGGGDRYATAGALARTFGTQVNVVYVATGENFPDALAGAARAGFNDGPVLLVDKDRVPGSTASAMAAINPNRVVVLGAEGSVNRAVAEELRGMTRSGNLQRVGGADRYKTAANLAAHYPTSTEKVFVATGETYPDALSGASPAGDQHSPVLLVSEDRVPGATKRALLRLSPHEIILVGGDGVISKAVENELADLID